MCTSTCLSIRQSIYLHPTTSLPSYPSHYHCLYMYTPTYLSTRQPIYPHPTTSLPTYPSLIFSRSRPPPLLPEDLHQPVGRVDGCPPRRRDQLRVRTASQQVQRLHTQRSGILTTPHAVLQEVCCDRVSREKEIDRVRV